MGHTMSSASAGPLCPRCRRKIAAWKLDHCIYCGEQFPENLREGFAEPEALKFVERPSVSPEAAKQLEMLKYVELGATAKPNSRRLGLFLVGLALPVLFGLFYMLYRVLSRWLPTSAGFIVGATGLVLLGAVAWAVARASS
jgi:hypothetical protein